MHKNRYTRLRINKIVEAEKELVQEKIDFTKRIKAMKDIPVLDEIKN